MTDTRQKALELYKAHGLQKASFLAFDNMQKAKDQKETDFWLKIINYIAIIDIQTLTAPQLLENEV